MEIKIKPYIHRLIKENIFYIISFFFILIFLSLIFFVGVNRVINYNNQIKKINSEIVSLKRQYSHYNYDNETEQKINFSIQILNKLIPNFEDYFSIIYALEKLSYKTGFMIISYSVDIQSSTNNKIRLLVSGIGDSMSFLNFLKEYNFGGGRLITSDKIDYNTEKSGIIKINLTFYNKNLKNSLILDNLEFDKNYEEILKEVENIKSKIIFDFDDIQVNENFSYPKKTNPFE